MSSVVSSNSLDEPIGVVVKRYSSLFTLPSQERIALSLFVSCVGFGALVILPSHPSYGILGVGLLFGVFVFLVVVSSDIGISHILMKGDPIFDFRRCSALSFFSCLLWLGLIFLGDALSFFLANLDVWVWLFLLGFCGVLMLRWIVLSTVSLASSGRVFLSSLLQPACYVALVFLMAPAIGFGLTGSLVLFIPLSIGVVGLTVLLFTFFVDRVGEKTVGISSLSLFKAFMANWIADLNAPLERVFEGLGSEREVGLSLLAFRGNTGMKAMIVVPAFHPGPFKNVGSSLFPSMVQDALEEKLQCVVSVPHGLFGHGLDLSSQFQSWKVIERVLDSMNFPSFESKATPFVRVEKNGASASCQIFGDCAFITLTLAPEAMEDLPEELNSTIVSEAEKLGLSSTIVIDAHNSINGPFSFEKVATSLRMAAVASLEEALNCQRSPFHVGASRVVPEEFGVEEGMGPGGISVIIIEVGDQKAAYVTFDGNNMMSGLREKILSMLRELGITEGEVLTTDTHAVNGVVLTPRGYHPVGEAMDQSRIIEYVREAATKALNNMEPAEVSWRREVIPNITVIGEKQIADMCALTEKVVRRARKMAITLFPIAGIILIALLAFV